MLDVVLVIADGLVGEQPHGEDGKNKKGNNYTEDSHKMNFICFQIKPLLTFSASGCGKAQKMSKMELNS